MCGVFGYVSKSGEGPNLKRLQAIARVTQQRGPHAFGFAWIDSRNRLRAFKQTGRISDHLQLLALASDAQLLIGHTRYATQGDPANNLNNHPHAADGGWIVHNGVIGNYHDLIDTHGLWPVTDCDSEVLGLLIEAFDGTLPARCAAAVESITRSPAVLLGLWAKPARLIAVRRGNPLHIASTSAGTYLASLRGAMPNNVRPIRDNHVLEFTRDRNGHSHAKQSPLDTFDRPHPISARSAHRIGAGSHGNIDAVEHAGGRERSWCD